MAFIYLFFHKNFFLLIFYVNMILMNNNYIYSSMMMIFMSFYLMKFINFSLKLKFTSFFFFMKKSNLYIMTLLFYMFFICSKLIFFYMFFELISFFMFIQLFFSSFSFQRLKASIYLFIFMSLGTFPLIILLFFLNNLFMIYFFLLSFCIKLPVLMFHLWLPKAHVEANFYESMLLAGILLKLGGYGIMNLDLCLYFNFIFFWGLISSFLMSFYIMLINDLKVILAISSIIHMNMLLFVMISNCFLIEKVFIILMISHGLISSLFFYFIGLIYEQSFSRSLLLNKSLFQNFFFLFIIFFFLILLNLNTPPFLSFFSEMYLFSLSLNYSLEMIFFSVNLIFLTVIFNLIMLKSINMSLLNKFFNSFSMSVSNFMVFFEHLILLFLSF